MANNEKYLAFPFASFSGFRDLAVCLLFSLLAPTLTLGQEKIKIRNLILEGAGIRGIAYCGAISELERSGELATLQRIGGTSAGAITGLCLSLGYNSTEISKIISSTNFKKFNDGRFLFPGGIHRTSRFYGWYRGRKFDRWLEVLISAKTGNAELTFREMHDQGFKDLYVTATNLTKQQVVVISWENFPDMSVRDAVRMSMSIPLYFEALFLDDNGKVVRHPRLRKDLSVMVDGGILANFPIHIFDSSRYQHAGGENSFVVNPETVGLRIDSRTQIGNDSLSAALAPFPIASFKGYVAAFYNIVIENLNRQNLTPQDWQRTISISDGGIAPRIRKMNPAEITLLIANGRQGAQLFLSKRR